ncbi:MAG: L-serine ammonia-lyase [Chloroflexi bacterium]|nr:L-serine ammonia-lyase [Chloroflexota bacterium]
MDAISVFDMLKIGVGPSSSHTMGPWRAARRFVAQVDASAGIDCVVRIQVELFGSLAKTGRGHGTDIAVLMGLSGEDPRTCDTTLLDDKVEAIRSGRMLPLNGVRDLAFDPDSDLLFHFDQSLDFHPNGMRFTAELSDGDAVAATYFSVGGGFVVEEGESDSADAVDLPHPCTTAADVLRACRENDLSISDLVLRNELAWRSADDVRAGLLEIWRTMAECIYRGCHTEGVLPGGLDVVRRAAGINRLLLGGMRHRNVDAWMRAIQARRYSMHEMVEWISCFALAVNEENAAFGRVVTAPTNGAAGVVPAVLMHYVLSEGAGDDDVVRFLLVAGQVGMLFKHGATISAAMGGCQAEIGVSAAMAAAALTEGLGGSPERALMAAEIAMEHHLGLTCDPIGGLVQIPCIERNAMGAMKAITATNIALVSSPRNAKVTLDTVIKTMWQTAQDMNVKYKETAEGGLAVQIPVNVIEC